jgi:hypothetical protein
MATLTQAQAQEILRQTSTVGVPTKTINSYGGLQAIRDIAGGSAYVQQRLAEETATNALKDAYNSGSISVAQIQAMENRINAGQDTTTAINRTLSQAAAPGTYEAPGGAAQPAASAYDYINQYLYQPFLKRAGDTEGVNFYGKEFGPYVDAAEAARFIRGAVAAEEIAPERGDELLRQISGYSYLEPLYQEYLGRPGDIGGLTSYAQSFGPEIDLAERQAFIEGAVGAGDLSRDRANELLAGLTSGADTGGATNIVTDTTGADTGSPAPNYDYINDLYKTYLGRDASAEELASYAGVFGPTIEQNEIRDFILGGVTSGELTQARADTLLGRLPSTQGKTSTVGALPGLPAIPTPPTFLPAAAAAQGRVDPYFLRTAAAPIAADPITGQPVLQGPTSLIQGTTPVAPPVAGMAEGGDVEGGMAKATPVELGSKFDISEFVDEQGRLVSGYSRPIRDEFGVIVGYEDRPYEENVVFGEKLRERQAAAPLNSERAMLDMLARQGRTGVNPMTGGLAGIQVGGPMMRNQPQYYSTIEAGRRYRGFAKGGLADIADDMSDMGRGEDTMLLHVSPEEVRGLDAVARSMMGTGLTINPYTGLPEADIFNKIGKGLKKIAKPLAKVLPFILPFTPLGPLAQGLISGLTTGLASGDAKKGLFAGLTSFGTANLAQGAQAAAQTGADAAAQAAAQAGADAAAQAAGQAGVDAATQAAGQAATQAGVDAASQAGAQAGLGALSAARLALLV